MLSVFLSTGFLLITIYWSAGSTLWGFGSILQVLIYCRGDVGSGGLQDSVRVGAVGRLQAQQGGSRLAGELQAQQGCSVLAQWGDWKMASTGGLQTQQGSSRRGRGAPCRHGGEALRQRPPGSFRRSRGAPGAVGRLEDGVLRRVSSAARELQAQLGDRKTASTGELQAQQGISRRNRGALGWRRGEAGRWHPQESSRCSSGVPGAVGSWKAGIWRPWGSSRRIRGGPGAAGELQAQQGSSMLA